MRSVAEHKGPQLVVQAWKTHIEGNGPDLIIHGPIIDAGAAAGHPVRPPLSRAGVWKALSEATALVMGSIWPENAPLVILEARAAGCPIVAPRIGGIPELVQEGRDGLLYEPGDAEDLGRALRALTMEPWTNIHPPPSHTDQVDAIYGLYEELTTA